MRTIILNGSPKAQNGNSEIFIQQFTKEMSNSYEVKYIAKEDPEYLAEYLKGFDSIIIVLPLYIHAMPGIVMKFIEEIEPFSEKKSLGFILQCGFTESSQCKYVESYFDSLARQLNCNYLGTALKGEAAGIYMMPKFMTKKIFKLLNEFGRAYDQTHSFDKLIMKQMQKPYELKKSNIRCFNFMSKIGLINVFWHSMLKKNNALEKRLDKPFLS